MFNPNILQDEINAVAAATEFSQVHFAIRNSGAIKTLVCMAEQSVTSERPICIKLEGQARKAASRVLGELIKHTQNGKNIFHCI